MSIRVGFGFDVHQLKEGEELMLGGIRIDHMKGTIGHSDADVLIHAICDALLGAAGLRDIGHQFPDDDPSYKGIDSKILLTRVVKLLSEKSFSIGNIDATVCLQEPRISDRIPQMQNELAQAMSVEPGSISIKATTSEKLGFVGREEGVAAYAVALISGKT